MVERLNSGREYSVLAAISFDLCIKLCSYVDGSFNVAHFADVCRSLLQ